MEHEVEDARKYGHGHNTNAIIWLMFVLGVVAVLYLLIFLEVRRILAWMRKTTPPGWGT